MIGGKPPSSYLSSIQTHKQVRLSDEAMDGILESHFIMPSALRQDDFEAFFETRKKNLLHIVEQAMGKEAEPGIQEEVWDDTDM